MGLPPVLSHATEGLPTTFIDDEARHEFFPLLFRSDRR